MPLGVYKHGESNEGKTFGAISPMEVPLEILQSPGTNLKSGAETISMTGVYVPLEVGRGDQAIKFQHIVHPYSTYM